MGALAQIQKQQQEKEARAKRDKWFADTTSAISNMQKQLDSLTSAQQARAQRRQSYSTATVGQQMGSGAIGGAGLRISRSGMAPSARRRMHRAG